MTFLQKRPVFFTNTQKTLFFWAFFEIFFFHFFFHVFCFSFSNIKKTKTKSAHFFFFFENPFFDTLTNCQKNIFAPLHTICVFKIPQKHYKTGENKQKISWTKFWRNLGPSFDSKTPNLGPSFDSTAYMCIYIYIYLSLSLSPPPSLSLSLSRPFLLNIL